MARIEHINMLLEQGKKSSTIAMAVSFSRYFESLLLYVLYFAVDSNALPDIFLFFLPPHFRVSTITDKFYSVWPKCPNNFSLANMN